MKIHHYSNYISQEHSRISPGWSTTSSLIKRPISHPKSIIQDIYNYYIKKWHTIRHWESKEIIGWVRDWLKGHWLLLLPSSYPIWRHLESSMSIQSSFSSIRNSGCIKILFIIKKTRYLSPKELENIFGIPIINLQVNQVNGWSWIRKNSRFRIKCSYLRRLGLNWRITQICCISCKTSS